MSKAFDEIMHEPLAITKAKGKECQKVSKKAKKELEEGSKARRTLVLLAELSVSRTVGVSCFLKCAVSYSVIFATRAIGVGYSTC